MIFGSGNFSFQRQMQLFVSVDIGVSHHKALEAVLNVPHWRLLVEPANELKDWWSNPGSSCSHAEVSLGKNHRLLPMRLSVSRMAPAIGV